MCNNSYPFVWKNGTHGYKIASENNIKIIEVAAQALGSKLNDRYAGTISNAGCFSLYPGKIITSMEGGLLVTNDEHTYDMALNVRNHDMVKGYDTETFGLNLRMTEIAAAIARVQFDRLDNFILERSKNARLLTKLLENTNSSTLVLRKGEESNWSLYTITLDDPPKGTRCIGKDRNQSSSLLSNSSAPPTVLRIQNEITCHRLGLRACSLPACAS